MNRTKYDIPDKALFRKTVKTAFAMRRKTLTNNLMVGFKVDRLTAENIIAEMRLSPNCRGEELSVEQFVQLYRIIEKQGLK